ncbi:hypothetical protein EBR03_10020, partial [bacterium]|nr:hypothetical protein [bacterium]
MSFYVVVLGLFLSLASYGAGGGTDVGDPRLLQELPEPASGRVLAPLSERALGRLALVSKALQNQVGAERAHRFRVSLTGGGPRPQGLEMMPGAVTFLCDRNQAQQVQDYIDHLPGFINILHEHVQGHGRPYVVPRSMPLHAAFESVPEIQQESLLELLTAGVGSRCSLETSFDFLKAALTHHLGHDYSVFGTEAVLREWSSNLTSWCEHLAGIISRDYVELNPQNWDPAVAKGKHVVVDRGVLDTEAHVGTLNTFFGEAENQNQSLIVNVRGATTLTMGMPHIPASVHNLMVTNTDGSVTA